MIELVVTTAVFGFILVGISALARLTFDEVAMIDDYSEQDGLTRLISNISQLLDTVAVVTHWDSLSVHYLDRRGEAGKLNLNTLSHAITTTRSNTEANYPLWITMSPKQSVPETDATQFPSITSPLYLLTINIQSHKVLGDIIQIQHTVSVIPHSVNSSIQPRGFIEPGSMN